MIIDLINLKKFPHDFEFEVSPSEVDFGDENFTVTDSIQIKGELRKGIAQTDINGVISADITIECTRCLQPVERSLEIPFKVTYVTLENYTEEKEAELRDDDLDVAVFGGDKIELNDLVREQVLLNVPIQIFCKENCQGLCEKCGANRNLIDCKCEESEIDPRWAVLKNLR